uniref:Uncharacterized protein n=1 Tax=Heterorhabditis bacteriophora TaxID=37862 RepID=A0A1I7XBE1_HETBA
MPTLSSVISCRVDFYASPLRGPRFPLRIAFYFHFLHYGFLLIIQLLLKKINKKIREEKVKINFMNKYIFAFTKLRENLF